MTKLPKLKAALVFSCSSRKSHKPVISHESLGSDLTQSEAAIEWVELMKDPEVRIEADKLFEGSGMDAITKIRPMIKYSSQIYYASSGSGLTQCSGGVVPYHFTADEKDDPSNIHTHLREKFNRPLWWSMINEGWHNEANPIAALCKDPENDFVIIAIYARHYKYIVHDILSIEGTPEASKLRIITLGSAIKKYPVRLRGYCLPYHKKFLDQWLGNRNNVPHRAAEHAIGFLRKNPSAPIEDQIDMLNEAQTEYLGYDVSKGPKKAEDQIDWDAIDWDGILGIDDPEKAYAFLDKPVPFEAFRTQWLNRRPNAAYEATAEQIEAARRAMGHISSKVATVNKVTKTISYESIQHNLQAIGMFWSSLSTAFGTEAVFSMKNLWEWYTVYHAGRDIPEETDSLAKLRKFLDAHLPACDLEKFTPENSSKVLYRFRSTS